MGRLTVVKGSVLPNLIWDPNPNRTALGIQHIDSVAE